MIIFTVFGGAIIELFILMRAQTPVGNEAFLRFMIPHQLLSEAAVLPDITRCPGSLHCSVGQLCSGRFVPRLLLFVFYAACRRMREGLV